MPYRGPSGAVPEMKKRTDSTALLSAFIPPLFLILKRTRLLAGE